MRAVFSSPNSHGSRRLVSMLACALRVIEAGQGLEAWGGGGDSQARPSPQRGVHAAALTGQPVRRVGSPEEWAEHRQLVPTHEELGVGVAEKPTDVGACRSCKRVCELHGSTARPALACHWPAGLAIGNPLNPSPAPMPLRQKHKKAKTARSIPEFGSPARLRLSSMGMETARWSQSAVLSPVQMAPTRCVPAKKARESTNGRSPCAGSTSAKPRFLGFGARGRRGGPGRVWTPGPRSRASTLGLGTSGPRRHQPPRVAEPRGHRPPA